MKRRIFPTAVGTLFVAVNILALLRLVSHEVSLDWSVVLSLMFAIWLWRRDEIGPKHVETSITEETF